MDLLNTAEAIIGNPMAVGRIDLEILYVSDGMPKDSMISTPGKMGEFDNEKILSKMEVLSKQEGPVLLINDKNIKRDKYSPLLTAINIDGELRGYLSILAVNRPHSDEDVKAAKIVVESLKILFRMTGDVDFCAKGDIREAIKAFIENQIPDRTATEILQENINKFNQSMEIAVIKYKSKGRANAIPQEATQGFLKLFKTELFMSGQGELVLITGTDATEYREELIALLERYHLCAGISYKCTPLVSLIFEAYYQASVASEMSDDENPCVFLFEKISDFFITRGKQLHRFNNMVHPAAAMLMEYDAERNTELCKTIFTYLNNKQSIKATAQSLGVHVNTINQRFAQMENLLSGYQFCSESLFDLYMSFRNK